MRAQLFLLDAAALFAFFGTHLYHLSCPDCSDMRLLSEWQQSDVRCIINNMHITVRLKIHKEILTFEYLNGLRDGVSS